MTDYNSYLNSLIVDCQRSLQCPSHQPQYSHIAAQYFATPPTPLSSYTFKEGQTVAPRPCISTEPPAIIAATAANPPRNVPSAAIAPQRSIRKDLPPAKTPRPGIPKAIPRPAVDPHTIVNKKVPPAVTAPRSAISGNLSPAAAAPSPFVPLFQLPIASSISACALQENHESTGPINHAEARQDTSKGYIIGLPDKGLRLRYQNLTQDAMRKELKARGLICHGPNADLFKRLEKDDEFQAKPRTTEKYDKMNPKDIRSLCFRRFIPSQGTISSLRGRLKAHDNRRNGREAAAPGLSPLVVPSGPLPTPEVKGSRDVLEEKPLEPTVNDGPASMTERTGRSGETAEKVALAQPLKSVEFKPMNFIQPRQTIHKACGECRKSKVSSAPTIKLDPIDSCHSVVVDMTRTARTRPKL